jgi:hypothetical protein
MYPKTLSLANPPSVERAVVKNLTTEDTVSGILKSLTGLTGFFCFCPVNPLYSALTPYIKSNIKNETSK